MNQYQVCVYAISKNEEKFVDRWMDAVSEADLVVVADTGSTDGTVEKLRARGAVVYPTDISPWRFDDARNAALSRVPPDFDLCVSNDLDEIFESGWRKKLESAWRPEYTRAGYWFAWSHHPDGSVQKRFPMEKIHRRDGFRWVRPVHETLEYGGPGEDRTLWIGDLVLHHYPDLNKPRGQYLPLLELSVQENPQDDRAMFWLGREYVYRGDCDRAIETLQRHLALPSARWEEERSASMRLIARCWADKGDSRQERAWLFRALAECPDVREPYLALAAAGYREADWPLVYLAVQKGLAVTRSTGSYLTEPESWGTALFDYGAIAAYRLGLLEESERYAEAACALSPEDGRLRANLRFLRQRNGGEGAQ